MLVSNYTNNNKMNNHLSRQDTKKQTTTYGVGNPGPDLKQEEKCVSVCGGR